MKKQTVKTYAKINLSLIITGIDACGYHMLDSVAASIDMYDRITIIQNQQNTCWVSCPLPDTAHNTAFLAAEIFRKEFNTPGIDIRIEKNIPFFAGLGGSSADAAGVLRALCSMYGVDYTSPVIQQMALYCGSDTVYMLNGGFARLTGKGEIVQPLDADLVLTMAIIKPFGGVSSAAAYREYDNLYQKSGYLAPVNGDNDSLVAALKTAQNDRAYPLFVNQLLQPSCRLLPEIKEVLRKAQLMPGAKACFMTGSGSAICAVFEDVSKAQACADAFAGQGLFAKVCKTIPTGIEFA